MGKKLKSGMKRNTKGMALVFAVLLPHTHTFKLSLFFFLNSFSVAPINKIFSSHKLFAALYEFRVPESIEVGSAVGVIRAMDADIGQNAEMDYRIIGSDGPGMFEITTNRSTQEGVILLRKVRHSLWGGFMGSQF